MLPVPPPPPPPPGPFAYMYANHYPHTVVQSHVDLKMYTWQDRKTANRTLVYHLSNKVQSSNDSETCAHTFFNFTVFFWCNLHFCTGCLPSYNRRANVSIASHVSSCTQCSCTLVLKVYDYNNVQMYISSVQYMIKVRQM